MPLDPHPPRFIPPPAKIVPTGNRYRSYRFVSFPPRSVAHRRTERSGELPDPVSSLFASSTSQRWLTDTRGSSGLWQAARSGSCLHYHTNGRSIQDLRSYLPTHPPVTRFTHAHTHVHTYVHTRARVSFAAYTRSRTPSRLSTCTLDHAFDLERNDRIPSLVHASRFFSWDDRSSSSIVRETMKDGKNPIERKIRRNSAASSRN